MIDSRMTPAIIELHPGPDELLPEQTTPGVKRPTLHCKGLTSPTSRKSQEAYGQCNTEPVPVQVAATRPAIPAQAPRAPATVSTPPSPPVAAAPPAPPIGIIIADDLATSDSNDGESDESSEEEARKAECGTQTGQGP
jgi:hypothetical protein